MKRENSIECFTRQFLMGEASKYTLQNVQNKYGIELPAETTNYQVLKSVFVDWGYVHDRQAENIL